MSAFVVDKSNIDTLVSAYLALFQPGAVKTSPDALGRMLWAENVKSVAYRYNMPERHAQEHAAYMRDVRNYRFEPCEAPPIELGEACDCYDYQSCEHPQWEVSRAKKIADLIAAALKTRATAAPLRD